MGVARKLITVELRNTIQTNMSPPSIRQNFHDECEKSLNKQINMEMYASYTYLSLYSYFIQHDKALHGFAKMLIKNSQEEWEHSLTLIDYLAKRGGKVVMEDIKKPEVDLKTAKDAVEAALQLEKEVNQSLLDLHVLAGDKGDAHLIFWRNISYRSRWTPLRRSVTWSPGWRLLGMGLG